MTNQEMIFHIADSMETLAKSIRHYAEILVSPAVPAADAAPIESPVPTPAQDPVPESASETEKVCTLEEVREVLAQKAVAGKNAEVRALIARYGADKLSAVDPARYADLMAEAEVL